MKTLHDFAIDPNHHKKSPSELSEQYMGSPQYQMKVGCDAYKEKFQATMSARVVRFKDMSPEKQAEMRRLYERKANR